MIFRRSCVISFIACVCLAALSCASTGKAQNVQQSDLQNSTDQNASKITLIFAGDIMAHANNYRAGHFDRIWQDVKQLIKTGDLCFANLEAPVNDKMEWSTYPQFNMHSEYVQAAVDAGFNVFSLANNHTNDWFLEGINATRTYFEKQKDVWSCGLKTKNDGKITYRLINKNGWKVLFCAFTEILNRPDYASWIDYFPSKKHDELVRQLKELSSLQHDLFVISVHTDEEEYKKKVTESHRTFFRRLIEECGADIIWANHPHVSKEFESLTASDGRNAFIMYANGNTISGQRSSPSFYKAPNERDDTGDGLIIKVTVEKKDSTSSAAAGKIKNDAGHSASKNHTNITKIEPHFITSYIRPDGQTVLKLVDDDLIHCLDRSGLNLWAEYIKSRKIIYEQLKGKSKWQ